MRVPVSWLEEYADLPGGAEATSDILTAVGIKVETIQRPGAEISGVVVGLVEAIEDHPKADNLILVDVVTGTDDHRRIVCGAHNFSAGDKVPVALVGGTLPGGMKLERRKIRGEVSDGMLCSARELGVSDDHTGILVLPPDTEVGRDIREVLGLDEAIIEFEITPNRPDAMSLIGIARELAAATGTQVRLPETEVKESGPPIASLASVEVADSQGCPRYLARVITGVTVGPSPDWVQKRSRAAGMRPVSNVVDATNYALWVTGHPMHAFDLDRLGGRKIIVRRAHAAERMTTIDEQDRELDPADLVIADSSRAVALAGIMGGRDTEVTEATKNILLESAYFDPTSILISSKRHTLRSEASARFERGADPNAAAWAADYASRLIVEWSGGEVAAGSIDVYPQPSAPKTVRLRPERADLVLGVSIEPAKMTDFLNRLGLDARLENGLIETTIPTRRPDISAEEDLVEEVARLFGYDNIPTTLPSGPGRAGGLTREQKLVREIKRTLAGAGIQEAYTSSLIGTADLEKMTYPEGHPAGRAVALANPVSKDEAILQPSLIPGLMLAVARNVSRRNLTVRLFQIAKCFRPSGSLLPNEILELALVMHGPVPQEWSSPARDLDFYDLKGTLDTLFDALNVEVSFRPEPAPPLHPVRSAAIYIGDQKIGEAGELSPEVSDRYDLPGRVLVAEIEVIPFLNAIRPPENAGEAPRFPAVLLDIAVVVDDDRPAAEVEAVVRRAGTAALESVRLFDLYRGDQAGEGRKSLAFSLAFRRPDRTLTDEEAVALRDAIAAAIEKDLGGHIRT